MKEKSKMDQFADTFANREKYIQHLKEEEERQDRAMAPFVAIAAFLMLGLPILLIIMAAFDSCTK